MCLAGSQKTEAEGRKEEGRRRKTGRGEERQKNSYKFSGDNDSEETPVPIPNTEVKLTNAENTCKLPCWEDK